MPYNNKLYRHVASYSLDFMSSKFLTTALLTAGTFGLAFCFSENVQESWDHILSGKVFSIYMEEPPTAKKVSSLQPNAKPQCVSTEMIWGVPPYYAAFTDLIYVPNLKQFLCCFRISLDPQVGDNGKIQIIASPDANTWSPVALLDSDVYDYRDPKLSLTPDGRLLLNFDATLWVNGQGTPNSAVSFSSDGINWSPVQLLANPGKWLWRVTWHKNIAYGGEYCSDEKGNTTLRLMKSSDAINYTEITKLDIPKNPTEATFRFLPDDTMVALVRRNNGPGVIGSSPPPYKEWKWFETDSMLGGPNFIILPDNTMLASSRQTKGAQETCVVARMSLNSYDPFITLPSSGDCGYPGLVYLEKEDDDEKKGDDEVIASYYASQTGRACIYRSVIKPMPPSKPVTKP